MRAIDGDALRDKLQNLADDEWNRSTPTSWGEAFTECVDMVEDAPTIKPEPQIIYSKAGYIMSLHKEYGCTLTRAEEAHNKALEYLRDKAMMKG